MGHEQVSVRKAAIHNDNALQAVEQLYSEIHQEGESLVLVFASIQYDLAALGTALKNKFGDVVAGCTTAGQIGPCGYQTGGLTGVSVKSSELQCKSLLISPLTRAETAVKNASDELRKSGFLNMPDVNYVSLVHLDGLSMGEERTMYHLNDVFPDLPFIGGSAGDQLKFARSFVYFDGNFLNDAATMTVLATTLDVRPIKFQHHEPTENKLVITRALPAERKVLEINGLPAADSYAEAVGRTVKTLDAKVFSKHPLMLKVGSEYFTRSIRSVNEDGSLTFYCAIDEGLVLRFGSCQQIMETMSSSLEKMTDSMESCELIIGYDCILRKLEIEREGLTSQVNALLSENKVIGFSTYGEQYNGLHINQTFTGLAIGKKPQRNSSSLPNVEPAVPSDAI